MKIKNKLQSKKTWIIVSMVLFLILVGSVLTGGFDVFGQSEEKIGANAVEFINNNLIGGGQTASLVKTSCDKKVNLCKINFDLSGKSIDAYISSDGKLFFPDAIDMGEFGDQEGNSKQPADVPFTEKPEVNLFVMSYCPFGLQSQKAMLPVMRILKEKADININFVNYAMHDKKEIDENLRQYCLENNDYDKYIDYLDCFVKNGESENCLLNVGVDQDSLSACVKVTDEEYEITKMYNNKDTWNGNYPKFLVEDDLNKKYQVGGSPTLVVNGVKVSVNRTPESYKTVICNAFKNAPNICEETLSENSPKSGFGVETTSSTNADAECN